MSETLSLEAVFRSAPLTVAGDELGLAWRRRAATPGGDEQTNEVFKTFKSTD